MEGRSMSHKLSQLKPDQSNLMDHIADFICKTTNILNKTVNHDSHVIVDALGEVCYSIAGYLNQLATIFLPGTIATAKDNEGRIRGIETADTLGQLPLLTADELQALKLFLADYKHQFDLAKNQLSTQSGAQL